MLCGGAGPGVSGRDVAGPRARGPVLLVGLF